jgi:hypothetical protein
LGRAENTDEYFKNYIRKSEQLFRKKVTSGRLGGFSGTHHVFSASA